MATGQAWRRGWWIVAFLVTALAVVPPAKASPPCQCSYLDSVFPTATEDLPTNVRFLVIGGNGSDLATLRLVPSLDREHPVAARIEAAGDAAGSRWVIPEAELAPDTWHVLEADGERPLAREVRTGSGPDTGNPTLDGLTITAQEMGGACGEHQSALIEATGLADDLAPEGSVLVRLEVTDPAADAWGPRTVFLSHGNAFVGGAMYVGTSDWEPECLGNLPGTASGHTYRARAVALDWAGNTSAESGPIDFEMVWSPGMDWACGCRAPGAQRAPAGMLFAGLLAGVLLFRRRGRCKLKIVSSPAGGSGSPEHAHRGRVVAALSLLGVLAWPACYGIIEPDDGDDEVRESGASDDADDEVRDSGTPDDGDDEVRESGAPDDTADAVPTCRTDVDCEGGTSCILGLCVCVVVGHDYPHRCSEEPGEIGSGASSACAAAPVDDTVAADEVAARDVGVWVDVVPNPLVADGLEHGIVRATITELSSGRRVVGAPVTFVSEGFIRAPDETVLDPCDETELGVPYDVLATIFLRDGASFGTVVRDLTTGPDGTVQTELLVPPWEDYMADRSLLLGAWYDVDGGGNPFAGRLVRLVPP